MMSTLAGAVSTTHPGLRTALLQRLRLLEGELAQAAYQVGGGPGAENLHRARALLAPALQDGPQLGMRPDRTEDPELHENPLLRLSSRELEVFSLLVAGKVNKEIAWELDLKATTVSTYRSRILEKLAVDNVPALVRLSMRFPPPSS